MSDFHLQQLATASAAVPEEATTALLEVETNVPNTSLGIPVQTTSPDNDDQAATEFMSCLDTDTSTHVHSHEQSDENVTIPVIHSGEDANPSLDQSRTLTETVANRITPQSQDQMELRIIPPSHLAHASSLTHQQVNSLITLDQTSQMLQSLQRTVSIPHSHDTPSAVDMTSAAGGDSTDIVEVMDLETKYQMKCNECAALRIELASKNARIRKLEQELYRKPSIIQYNNNQTKDSMVNTMHHELHINTGSGPSSTMAIPTTMTPPINNSLLVSSPHGPTNAIVTTAASKCNSHITIDVDIGPSSSRTRSYDQRWKARFQDLVKYKLMHGHCIVPKSFHDKGLHSWVRKQRILKKEFDLGLASDESMTQERVHALNSVGFAWVVGHQSNDAQWEANFQQLVVFKSQYGHSRVPQSYDKTLHKWVLNQRCRRRLLEEKGEGKAKGMTWARIEKLDAIDFSWTGKK